MAARMDAVSAKLDFDTLEWTPHATGLAQNDVAHIDLDLAEPIAADRHHDSRRTGGILLVDDGGRTLGAGIIR